MPTATQLTFQGLHPIKGHGTLSSLALPCGGPTGVGGGYAQGLAVGLIGGATANHVFTLTMTLNGATGFKGYFLYQSGDKPYSGLFAGAVTANASSAYPTAAQLQAALIGAVPQWAGNVTVTGSSSGPYTITFNNLMAARRVGGLLTFTVTASTGGTPTGAVTVGTAGCAGAAQAELYATGGTPNRVDGFLPHPLVLDPVGAPVTPLQLGTGQVADGYPVWTRGIFLADQTNAPEKSVQTGTGAGLLDSNAFTVTPYKLVFHSGLSLSDAGVMIELL